MASLFVGISPNPEVPQLLRKVREFKPERCTAPKRLINRVTSRISKLGDLLGLTPGVVHAQSGCYYGYTPRRLTAPAETPVTNLKQTNL
jgi:hypothetical protein